MSTQKKYGRYPAPDVSRYRPTKRFPSGRAAVSQVGRAEKLGRVNIILGVDLKRQAEQEAVAEFGGWSPYVRKLVEKDIKSRARKRAGGKA